MLQKNIKKTFENFSKVFEKNCEGICFLKKLQTVAHYLQVYFKDFAKPF